MDSDLDLVVLSDDPSQYVDKEAWVADALGGPGLVVRSKQWGSLTERRVRVSSGFEVEFGFAPLSWATTTPCEQGTVEVVRAGLTVLFDPSNLLRELARAVAP
jgi:hypothetical protein